MQCYDLKGVLALEEALSKGLPIQKEIEVLHTSLEGIDNNSLVELVLSSLPEETQRPPTDIGTSRLSSGTSSPRDSFPHLSGLRLRDSSDSDVQTSTPPFSEPWVLWHPASKEINKTVRESVRRFFHNLGTVGRRFQKIIDKQCLKSSRALNEQNKKAKSSLKGGSLHTGGAKNVGVIVREMEKDLGRGLTQLEIFR
ncbi:hypothetical protein BC332_19315 [Capsicum chinense]|nr:hypothetical protein BC332_19315 [Capsicum chinense]